MKIAIFTDVHANLPALEAALTAIEKLDVDLIVHTGDAIAIGPHPAECLDRLLQLPHKRLIMGNHDAWFAFGLPQPRPDWMSDGELAHQQWTHTQLSARQRHEVQQWPFAHSETFAGVRVLMTHYGLDKTGRDFAKFVPSPQAETLDRMFADCDCDLVFYGHDHRASDVTGRARYVNPGSLGCYSEAVARFVELVCENGRYTLTHHAIPYDDASLFAALNRRQVPDRSFIRKNFYNGRG